MATQFTQAGARSCHLPSAGYRRVHYHLHSRVSKPSSMLAPDDAGPVLPAPSHLRWGRTECITRSTCSRSSMAGQSEEVREGRSGRRPMRPPCSPWLELYTEWIPESVTVLNLPIRCVFNSPGMPRSTHQAHRIDNVHRSVFLFIYLY